MSTTLQTVPLFEAPPADVRIIEAARQIDQAERQITAAARELHDAGWTWEQIGSLLGITRQAASRRYSLPAT
ncbi:hypothetical protein AB0E52_12440 [Micrococcus luteus]|uniref:hypothetical protein n=1 Tax=Micrococcus luteus TaxID=1270 RepID=UPI0034100D90